MVLLKKTNVLCFCDYFERSIPCIKTYCLERNVHISMIVTTNDSFRGKKTLVNYYLSRYYTNNFFLGVSAHISLAVTTHPSQHMT